MAIDPITTLVVSAAAGGAAGEFVKELSVTAASSLRSLFQSHSPKAQRQAKENSERFLGRLAKRVELLEKELPSEREHIFNDALDHPATSLLMQKALLTAAVTDNDDRHEILSELIAQRLNAGADDMIALVGSAACDIVGALASKHIRLLAIMAVMTRIRPNAYPQYTAYELYSENVRSWWDSRMKHLIRIEDQFTHLDFAHLKGVACIAPKGNGLWVLSGLLDILETEPYNFKLSLDEMVQYSWWKKLVDVFDKGIIRHDLTSIGELIGILFHDSNTGQKTEISWGE